MAIWSNQGGFMASAKLSNELRIALRPIVKWRQFCDVQDASMGGLHRGSIFNWDVYSKVATAGGQLPDEGPADTVTPGTEMPSTDFTITQGSIQLEEFGNSVPYSGKLDDLSEHPIKEIIQKVLKIDAQEGLDTAAAAQFDLTPIRATATSATQVGFTQNGIASGISTGPLTKEHVKLIVDEMKERSMPAYDGNDYYCIARPRGLRTFKNNLETINQYVETGVTLIRNGEVGRYEGVRFVEQTHLAAGSGMGTSAATWSGGGDWACFFGADTVAEAVAVPEELRGKIPTDYGRSRGIAWYYLGNFGLVHTLAMGQAEARAIIFDSVS